MSAVWPQMLASIHYYNILPLTSNCNMNCLFCSHRQNPPGLQVYRIPPQRLADIAQLLIYLDPARKIVIGESATRIIEGEPFLHPEIIPILQLVRQRFPRTPIELTTNGSFLTETVVQTLKTLMPLELNVSLNSANPVWRQRLMQDQRAAIAVAGVQLLKDYGIPYHGSIVAMPHYTGWEDLAETVAYLAANGAQTIRIFRPGFAAAAPAALQFSPADATELAAFINKLQLAFPVPLLLEPAALNDLTAVLSGTIPGSAAAQAGLQRGDRLVRINGILPRCRVEAYNLLRQATRVHLRIKRNGVEHACCFEKPPQVSAGAVFAYDLDPAFWTGWVMPSGGTGHGRHCC